jgi:hypothetical protein
MGPACRPVGGARQPSRCFARKDDQQQLHGLHHTSAGGVMAAAMLALLSSRQPVKHDCHCPGSARYWQQHDGPGVHAQLAGSLGEAAASGFLGPWVRHKRCPCIPVKFAQMVVMILLLPRTTARQQLHFRGTGGCGCPRGLLTPQFAGVLGVASVVCLASWFVLMLLSLIGGSLFNPQCCCMWTCNLGACDHVWYDQHALVKHVVCM